MARQRKMVNLDVRETSGVDHPAHLHEGWVVAKNAGTPSATEAFRRFLTPSHKEHTVPEITEADLTEAVAKAVAEATAPLTEQITTLTSERDEAVAKAATVEPVVETEPTADEALAKALGDLPEPVREMLAKQATDLADARESFAKERDARLDEAAVASSRETFKSLAVDHDVVAPALRRMDESAPEVAKAIREALTKADAQAESGKVFSEIGRSGSPLAGSGAMTKATALAKAAVEAGTAATIEQGVAKAFSDNPDLYAEYRTEKAGN